MSSRAGPTILALGLGLVFAGGLQAQATGDAGAAGEGMEPARSQLPAAAAEEGASSAEARPVAPTRIMIRAVAHDAKVIGSNVGGARIVVREADGGRVLAEGVQDGSTGDTEAIMLGERARSATAYGADPEAAGFVAELEIDRPVRVEIVAEGPLGTPHAMQRAVKTLLAVPGEDVLGEGVILDLHGFTVELLEPTPEGRIAAGEAVPVRARVTMLCGCPTEPGGMWDSSEMDIRARLLRDGEVLVEGPLSFSGETSVYEGSVAVDGAGPVTLEVLASDPEKANFGMVERRLEVGAAGGTYE